MLLSPAHVAHGDGEVEQSASVGGGRGRLVACRTNAPNAACMGDVGSGEKSSRALRARVRATERQELEQAGVGVDRWRLGDVCAAEGLPGPEDNIRALAAVVVVRVEVLVDDQHNGMGEVGEESSAPGSSSVALAPARRIPAHRQATPASRTLSCGRQLTLFTCSRWDYCRCEISARTRVSGEDATHSAMGEESGGSMA